MSSQVTVYQAEQVCSLLGVHNTCTVPMPDVSCLKPGEVLLWYPPGFTLTQLRNSALGKECMWQSQDWYDEKNFASAKPGYYVLQLRVPNSTRKTWQEQQVLLAKGGELYQPGPAAVAALALILHLKETGNDLLQNDWYRCVEVASQDYRVVLAVCKGHVRVGSYWDGNRHDYLWLAAARKF